MCPNRSGRDSCCARSRRPWAKAPPAISPHGAAATTVGRAKPRAGEGHPRSGGLGASRLDRSRGRQTAQGRDIHLSEGTARIDGGHSGGRGQPRPRPAENGGPHAQRGPGALWRTSRLRFGLRPGMHGLRRTRAAPARRSRPWTKKWPSWNRPCPTFSMAQVTPGCNRRFSGVWRLEPTQ